MQCRKNPSKVEGTEYGSGAVGGGSQFKLGGLKRVDFEHVDQKDMRKDECVSPVILVKKRVSAGALRWQCVCLPEIAGRPVSWSRASEKESEGEDVRGWGVHCGGIHRQRSAGGWWRGAVRNRTRKEEREVGCSQGRS